MVGSRTLTAAAGLLLSLAVTLLLWWYFGSLLVFLFVPFVPFLFRRSGSSEREARPPARECPACGFRTRDAEYEFCPRDGTELVRER